MEKITKEQLVVKAASLEESNQRLRDNDKSRRIEFAKAFVWFKKKELYDFAQEYKTPTWEEIFVEVGKLLAARNFYDFEGNVSELECKLEDLENKIRKEIQPNL